MDQILGFSGPDLAKIACDLRWEEALFFSLNYWHSLIFPLNRKTRHKPPSTFNTVYFTSLADSKAVSSYVATHHRSTVITADVAPLHLSSLSSPKPSDTAAVPGDGGGGGDGWSGAGVRVLPTGVQLRGLASGHWQHALRLWRRLRQPRPPGLLWWGLPPRHRPLLRWPHRP